MQLKTMGLAAVAAGLFLSCGAESAVWRDRARALEDYRAARDEAECDILTKTLKLAHFLPRANEAFRARAEDDRPVCVFVSFSGVTDGLHHINEVGGHIGGTQSIIDFGEQVRRHFDGPDRLLGYQGSSGILVYCPDGDTNALFASVREMKRAWHDVPYSPVRGVAVTNAALHVAWGRLPGCGATIDEFFRTARSVVNRSVGANESYSFSELPSVSDAEALAAETAALRTETARFKDLYLRSSNTALYKLLPFLEKSTARTKEKQDGPRALVAMDGDRFSRVNIEHGRESGGVVVRAFADILRRRFPESPDNLLCNPGESSDEFYLFLLGRPSPAAVKDELDALLKEIRTTSFRGATGETFTVTFSAGAYFLPEGPVDFAQAFEQSDAALYDAKNAGRDRVILREAPRAK